MLHSHAAMPGVEPVVEHRHKFQGVVAGRVWHAQCFGEDEEHEEILFLAARAGDGAPMRHEVELTQHVRRVPERCAQTAGHVDQTSTAF